MAMTPRPKRAGPVAADPAAAAGDSTRVLDGAPQSAPSSRTGQIGEADLELELARSVARRMGWVDKDEWKRDPTKWTDAPQFLEQTPRQLQALKESRARNAQAAADAIEESRRVARAEALAEVAAAAEASDPVAAQAAADKLARASRPHPTTEAWLARNSWFHSDPIAQQVTVAEINRLAAAGRSIPEQLEMAEAVVRKRFPEHFEGDQAPVEPDPAPAIRTPTREVPLSQVARAAPAVASGSRAPASAAAPKVKGFTDMPAADQATYKRLFAKKFESMGLKPEAAQARYASTYWRNLGEAD